MSISSRIAHCAALIGLSVLAASQASAALLPTLRGGAPTFSAGVYTYTYDVQLTGDSQVNNSKNPAFITFYDFKDYVKGSASFSSSYSNDFKITEQAFGRTGYGTVPADSADTNVTFDYTGTQVFVGPKDPFITVTLKSTSGMNPAGQFTQYTGQTVSHPAGTIQGNIGLVYGPNLAGGGFGGNTPEPGTVAMLVSSTFGGLCAIRRRRR